MKVPRNPVVIKKAANQQCDDERIGTAEQVKIGIILWIVLASLAGTA